MTQDSFTTSIATPLATLDADARQRWDALAESHGMNVSLGPAWLSVVERTVSDVPMQVLWAEGRLAFPFFRSTLRVSGIRLRVLELATNVVSYHADLPASSDDTAFGAALDALMPWDLFRVVDALEDGRIPRLLNDYSQHEGLILDRRPGDKSPYLSIAQSSWGSLIAAKDKKFRYKLKSRARRFESNERFRFVWYDQPEEVGGFLDCMLTIESRSSKVRRGIVFRPKEVAYYQALLPMLASHGQFHGGILRDQDTPIAYTLCCHHSGWFGHLKTSFDEAHAALSPGSYVVDRSVLRALEVGAGEFDFLGANNPRKMAWTKQTRPHASYFLYNRGVRPRIAGILRRLKYSLFSRGGHA